MVEQKEIVGISASESNSRKATTLHLLGDFDAYQDNPSAGRTCVGKKAESVYVGDYDCSSLEVGQIVEIYYGKAITTAKGTFQPVTLIRVIED